MQTGWKYFMADFSSFESGAAVPSWHQSVFLTDLHQNHIRANLANLIPWDNIFLVRAEQAAQPERTGDDNGADTAFAFVKYQIVDPAETFAVTAVDDIFFL